MKLKSNLKYISVLVLGMAGFLPVYAGGPDDWFRPDQWQRNAAQFAHDIDSDLRNLREQQERHRQAKRADFQEQLRNAQSPEERAEILRQQRMFEDALLKSADRWDNVGAKATEAAADVVKNAYGTAFDMMKHKQQAETEKQKAAIEARERGKAIVKGVNDVINACTNPQNMRRIAGYGSLLALGVFGAKHGTNLAAQMINSWYKIPRLAEETSLLSWRERMSNFFYGIKQPEGKIDDVVLEPKLQEQVTNLGESLKHTVKNGAFLPNILFYGPPGTGKTMLAKRLAYNCGLEWIYFAASSLDQMSLDLALSQLTELFEFAKRSSKKLMIIIDEAEILFANRDKNLSENTRKMLTHILTYTGTETRDYMVIALTNRPEDLDSAFLSRCDDRIKIDAPAAEQRKEILRKYIHKYLEDLTALQPRPTSLFGRIFGSNEAPKAITIEPGALNDEAINVLNAKIEGFVGRDISKLVIAWQKRAYATENGVLTPAIIESVTANKIAEKRAEAIGFGKTKKA